MRVTEKELKDRCEELEILRAQLSQTPQVTEEKPSVETEATVQAEIQVQIFGTVTYSSCQCDAAKPGF